MPAMSRMTISRVAVALAALVAPPTLVGATFSRLAPGSNCDDFKIPDIGSKDECFNAAATALGISTPLKLQIDGVGFNGCAFNTVANALIYSVTPGATAANHASLPTLQFICNGVATTTTTVTTTATTGTTTTTSGIFAKLGGGSRCSDEGVPDVLSKEACFSAAQHLLGLGGATAMELNNVGFTGCLFNSAANMMMYGTTPGVSSEANLKLPTFEYVCSGIPTTTTTTTATLTTTTVAFTRLGAGQRCSDQSIPSITSKEACFGAAASAVGLGQKFKLEVNFMGFTGCVYNAIAGFVMYGETPGVTAANTLAFPHFQYLCDGHAAALFP
uniref:Subtilisin n=1 Tax=Alexandrium andersonii TaxID=327968 RepID=A0A7S2ATF3_9DINO|mmetsp:Transcript_17728/g.40050  ORF Transcript_17728/g.40050 Transcript_17728/m.40050 type:complete len:330 (+) Transcript_17728:72-1061(+)